MVGKQTSEEIERRVRMADVFLPNVSRGIKRAWPTPDVKARFVHYTSAEAARNIIKSKRLWMRSPYSMADYREVAHGSDCWFRMDFTALINAMEPIYPGLVKHSTAALGQRLKDVREHVYVASFSEHDSTEDAYGRLSMWRAFGTNAARVAMVFSLPWFSNVAQVLNVTLTSVAYSTEADVAAELAEVVVNVEANRDFLREINDAQFVGSYLVQMLIHGMVCTKHPGFHEEKEWRAVYLPVVTPSPFMKQTIETPFGVPQPVYSIPLDANVTPDLAAIDISTALDRVIIGPTQYPWPMARAFIDTLSEAGVGDSEQRVFVSDIPIRT